MLADDPFSGYDISAFIGEHVDPELPVGVFGFRPGKYMASSDELRITVRGVGGHGAQRELLRDPVVAAAEIITALHGIPGKAADKSTPTVLSIGRVIADGATNIIPDNVYMEGTLRTFDEPWRREARDRITTLAQSVARSHGVDADVDISIGYPPVVNDDTLTDKAVALTGEMFGQGSTVALQMRPTSEDFGFYSLKYPSVFYRLGVGRIAGSGANAGSVANACAGADACAGANAGVNTGSGVGPVGRLHTPLFNPDESALQYGVAAMVNLAVNLL